MNADESRPDRERIDQSSPRMDQPSGMSGGVRIVSSAELFGDNRVVVIDHCGESYRLTITRNNKLILQK